MQSKASQIFSLIPVLASRSLEVKWTSWLIYMLSAICQHALCSLEPGYIAEFGPVLRCCLLGLYLGKALGNEASVL